MKKWVNNSKKGMAVFGAAAFMLLAGWQFGVSEDENAQEKEEIVAYASSGTPCGGPKHEATFMCLSLNTINCKDTSGCQD
ncbi:hypothetical protein SAMN04488057_11718 [Cyclobacterium lianum]|uniref:NVEALA protein n=1 Tax=Cyclobacterium lianum TaxID=388280 RepID=A0A1M7QEA7_9BACT|nr:hypothetical protein [Cyclobacterium lianum]SHN29257.1 hypothetical protein SAMN04488057_11718 [Cyclobacterium lianum]